MAVTSNTCHALHSATVEAKTVDAISTPTLKTLRLETRVLRPVDVDDENLKDEKEENADRHGVPGEDETDDDDDYVDNGWV